MVECGFCGKIVRVVRIVDLVRVVALLLEGEPAARNCDSRACSMRETSVRRGIQLGGFIVT